MNIKPSVIHFGMLVVILALGVVMFIYEKGNKPLQLSVGIVTAIAYSSWGIIHHAAHNNIHKKIVVEYTLIGVIAIVLLLTIFG